jgi:medium-chain acyl-[acyl-carrier-protein] hydrolase
MKYKTESYIESKHVQSNQIIRFPHYVRIFQDAAFEHSHFLGVGVNELLKKGLAWVLYSMYIEVYSYPKLGDKIITTTWCKEKKGITIERDYEVVSGGRTILKATSIWVLFSIEKRRAIIIPDDLIALYGPENDDVLPNIRNKLPFDNNIKYNYDYKFKTRFLDLDSNDHVNNITYIDYICTAMFRYLKIPIYISNFNIIFKKEITIENEEITLKMNHNKNKFNFRISDNTNFFSYGFVNYR